MNTERWISSFFRKILFLQAFTMLSGSLGMLVDSAVTACFLGENAMSAFGLVSPIGTVSFALSMIFGTGIGLVCVNESTRKEQLRVRDLFATSSLLALGIGLLFTILLFAFRKPIILFMCGESAEPAIFASATEYLKYFAFAEPAMIANMICLSTFQMDGEDRLLVVAVSAAAFVNITLDFMTVFVFRNGLAGMALATTISTYVEMAILMLHFRKENILFRFSDARFDFSEKLSFVKKGLPTALHMFFMAFLTIFCNAILLKRFGSSAVAALAAISSVGVIVRVMGDAAGSTVITLATLSDGERDESALHKIFVCGIQSAVFCNVAATLLVFTLASPIIGILFASSGYHELFISGLRYLAVGLVFYAVCYVIESFYLAVGDFKLLLGFALASDFVIPLLMVLIQVPVFGIHGVWLSFVTGKLISVLLYLLYIKLHGKSTLHLEDMVLLSNQKYIGIQTLTFDIYDAQSCISASERTRQWLCDQGLETRIANGFSMAVEELVTYILRYGSAKGQGLYVNILLCFDRSSVSLRIRDNGKGGNPLCCLVGENPIDEFSIIGIRIVRHMFEDIRYVTAANSNNLIVISNIEGENHS